MKVTVLAEDSCSFVLKPVNALQQSSDLLQVGATPFSPIYSSIHYLPFQAFVLILWQI